MSSPIAFRMDDVGASTKRFEVYSKRWRGLGNFLFLKYLPYFKAWGPYRELTADDWNSIVSLLEDYNAKITVAVTATWVEENGECIPYPLKWPKAYLALRRGVERGRICIACHGLTHCVIEGKAFLPRLFSSNRIAHREFWPWLPATLHYDHLAQAKKILETAFSTGIDILVPPGNVFSDDTVKAASQLGFRILNCQTDQRSDSQPLRVVGNDRVVAFHDREVVFGGMQWFRRILDEHSGSNYVFVNELPR